MVIRKGVLLQQKLSLIKFPIFTTQKQVHNQALQEISFREKQKLDQSYFNFSDHLIVGASCDRKIILYTTEDGKTAIHLKAEEETVWLTQIELADLFQTTKQNISLHIKNILSTNELSEAVVKDNLTTATDGKRYKTKLYNLSMILAIGYRVESQRGVQFRRWATIHLQEYLVKGFVINDARLKEPKPWDYFDEWLGRIREIRASEKRFYQKVRDIYATAVDYDPKSEQAQLFFKKVSNNTN